MKFLVSMGIIVCLVCVIILLSLLVEAYQLVRRKMNKPRIGFEYFLLKMLNRYDYVCINGRVLQFSHISKRGDIIDPVKIPNECNLSFGGELAFSDMHSLGYILYPVSSLQKCDFIYGKYGLKWASSNHMASLSETKVHEFI